MVKIRLLRAGAKKRPYYRVIAIDERAKRDGRAVPREGRDREKDNEENGVTQRFFGDQLHCARPRWFGRSRPPAGRRDAGLPKSPGWPE